ncbi:MAG: hypothetical protein IMZ55_14680 [Acidobacteria bacterium]|nr:hypothetical protein [Acidobacteriota bacterium]
MEVLTVQALLRLRNTPTLWVFPGPDPPDVVARLGGKCVGIEVTEYAPDARPGGSCRKEKLANLRGLQKWLEIGRCKHRELDRVNGKLYFSRRLRGGGRGEGVLPAKAECPRFTRQLYEFASRRLVRLTEGLSRFDQFDATHYDLLDRYLQRLDLSKVRCYINWDIVASDVTDMQWGDSVEDSTLAAAVQKKAKRLHALIQKPDVAWACDEFWLLIVTGDMYAPALSVSSTALQSFPTLNGALKALPRLCRRVLIYSDYLNGVTEWQRGMGWRETVLDSLSRGRPTG